ncbi:unnamed protein product [Anisakis simplex]|uniref:BBS7 n=1 Tax=Anisakis simplex TaxID=6269 RepID=A0A0M3JU78_ANISI|nr:unnamed protein product [Anisakis simplex]
MNDKENLRSTALLIADHDHKVFDALIGDKSASTSSSKAELLINNKYYAVTINLHCVDDLQSLSSCNGDNLATPQIGAIIYKFDGSLEALKELKKKLNLWQADVQIMVCDRLERDAEWTELLTNFCVMEQFELIELNPDQETLLELEEYAELHGIDRIRQVLESAEWINRVLKENNSHSLVTKQEMSHLTAKYKEGTKPLGDDEEFGEFMSAENDLSEDQEVKREQVFNSLELNDVKCTEAMQHPTCSVETSSNTAHSLSEVGHGNVKEKSISMDSQPCDVANTKSMIDNLIAEDTNMMTTSNDCEMNQLVAKVDRVRCALSQMSFGEERQKLAVDTMMEVIKALGMDDLLLSSSSDEEDEET